MAARANDLAGQDPRIAFRTCAKAGDYSAVLVSTSVVGFDAAPAGFVTTRFTATGDFVADLFTPGYLYVGNDGLGLGPDSTRQSGSALRSWLIPALVMSESLILRYFNDQKLVITGIDLSVTTVPPSPR